MVPWWWFRCKSKHVGAASIILIRFNNSTSFYVVCVSWVIKWLTDPRITSAVIRIPKFWMQGHLRWTKTSHPTSGSVLQWRTQRGGGWKSQAAVPHPQKRNLKNTDFVDTIISKVLCDLLFILNQRQQSAGDKYFGIFKNVIKSYEYVYFFI